MGKMVYLMQTGYLQNDLTVRQLVLMSQVLVEAGCDILAPSDMMDGRIGHIRRMLETGQYML